jgi:hypothetical protein
MCAMMRIYPINIRSWTADAHLRKRFEPWCLYTSLDVWAHFVELFEHMATQTLSMHPTSCCRLWTFVTASCSFCSGTHNTHVQACPLECLCMCQQMFCTRKRLAVNVSINTFDAMMRIYPINIRSLTADAHLRKRFEPWCLYTSLDVWASLLIATLGYK